MVAKLKYKLEENENVIKDSISVVFDNISDNGIDVSINFYTNIIDFSQYIKFKEERNYEILELLEEQHIELAYQTIHIDEKK